MPDTTIDNSYDINVIMVGFGELNKKILIGSVANNQLLTRDSSGKIIPKIISYTVLAEGVNNGIKEAIPLFRYENELFRYDEDKKITESGLYLELPPLPANVDFIDTKFDTGVLLDKISELSGDENKLTIIIIDSENTENSLNLASELFSHKMFKGKTDSIKVFCRTPGTAGYPIYTFGIDSDFYNATRIIEDKIYNMAIGRNRIYTLESEYLKDIADGSFDGSFDEIIALADYKWYTKRSYADKASNIYAMLSIRSKLNLLGLDYAKVDDPREEIDNYDTLYTKGEIEYIPDIMVMGRKIPAEMTYEFTTSVRGILAHQEHYRWNSFMLSMGYIPASIDNILNERNSDSSFTNGKNISTKRHGNITTDRGLIKYRQLLSVRDGCSELERDVICYDYQLMDDVIWLLKRNGYKIIARGEEND